MEAGQFWQNMFLVAGAKLCLKLILIVEIQVCLVQAWQVKFARHMYNPILVSDSGEEGSAAEQTDKISAFRERISCASSK